MLVVAAVVALFVGLVTAVNPASASAGPSAPANPSAAKPAAAKPAAAKPASTGSATISCPQLPGRLWCLAEAKPAPVPVPSSRSNTPNTTNTGELPGLTPTDLHQAYGIPDTTEATTIAVVDAYDNPTAESDLAAYRAEFDLPPCTTANGCFKKVNEHGQASPLPTSPPAATQSWMLESSMDVEMVSAVCPTCHIVLIETVDDEIGGHPHLEYGVHTAAKLGYKYISMSWGTHEFSNERSVDAEYLGYSGVTYVAASGDDDYGTSWPAVNPNVVSVGGTSLTPDGSARGFSETAWGFGAQGHGTGSGCSVLEPRPYWQSSGSPSLCGHRAMNDVAATADPDNGVAVYWGQADPQTGSHWYFGGGTSSAAPIITAMYALAGHTTGASPASYPYVNPSQFNDITGGANGINGLGGCDHIPLCNGVTGWDGPTGVGSPEGIGGFAPPPMTTIKAIHNPGAQETWEGSGVAIRAVGQDSDSRVPLTYSATGLPPGATIGADGNIRGRAESPGSRVVTVTVRDANGATGKMAFRWTVIEHHIAASSTPHITGSVARGHVVTLDYTSFRYDKPTGSLSHPTVRAQWYFNGHPIGGAIYSSFRIPTSANWAHGRLSVRLTATQTYCVGYSYASPSTAPLA
jgi:hypothetical protein